MKSIRWLVALCALVLLAPLAPAHAQSVTAVYVASCGTPPSSPVAGVPGFLTQDLTGKLCSSATGGGGSSYTVTGGAAGTLTNLYTPAGGSDGTTYRMFKTDTSGDLNVVFPSAQTVNAAQSGTWNVTNISGTISLPTGAATAANQATEIASLATIATNSGTGTQTTGSAVPSSAIYMGAQSGGNLVGVIQANASAFLNMTTATTTKIITGVAAKKVYITAFRLHSGGTTTAKFVEGTGTNCGTGTADLSETFDFTASDGSNQGNGLGPVLVAATAADDICVTSSAAVNLRVGAAYEIH